VQCRDLTVPMANEFRSHLLKNCSLGAAARVWFHLAKNKGRPSQSSIVKLGG
jgi:hypothetical protein